MNETKSQKYLLEALEFLVLACDFAGIEKDFPLQRFIDDVCILKVLEALEMTGYTPEQENETHSS